MAVYDQWHKAGRRGDQPCRCGTAKNPLYPSARHKTGDRWQVRWRDDNGKQQKKTFRLKEGRNPGLHADAYDAKVQRDLDTDDYTDPSSGDITLREYAEDWRKSRAFPDNQAVAVELGLRLHVYEDPERPGSGRTPRGGVAIGQRRMRELAKRPSLIQAWITAMPLAARTASQITGTVSAVFRAAADDGIVGRDPTRAESVDRPSPGRTKARPWSRAYVDGMARHLLDRLAVVPYLGGATGMRQGEMLGLAVGDIQFLGKDPRIKVVRQLKFVRNRPHFAPLKNRKPHTVPLSSSLAGRLSRHLAAFPAVPVTLPWYDPRDKARHEKPVTVELVLTAPEGRSWTRQRFNDRWHAAQELAGITPQREPGEKRAPAREDGCHALRHTAASAWLAARIDVVRVAAWLGDTPEMVWRTYAHLMPEQDDDDGRRAMDEMFGEPCAPDVPREHAADG